MITTLLIVNRISVGWASK